MNNKDYNPFDNLDEYNELVDKMAADILEIVNSKPTKIGQTAMLYILTNSYKTNGYSLRNFLSECADCWNHYET